MSTSRPVLYVNGLPSVAEDPSPTAMTPVSRTSAKQPSDRASAKLNMLRTMRPPVFKHAWSFYHDKHGTGSDYQGRLTLLLEDIITAKPFWQSFNNFSFEKLEQKDSVHFFKRGVKPVWEAPRNVKGGCWTFRVGKSNSKEFWKEILCFAVGEAFTDVIQPGKLDLCALFKFCCNINVAPGDDICGLSYSVRFNSVLITIWNRDGSNEKSINGIRDVVLEKLSPELKPKDNAIFYKKHSEHAGFEEAVAKAQALEDAKKVTAGQDRAKSEEAEVKPGELDKALLKQVEDDATADADLDKHRVDSEVAGTDPVMAWRSFAKDKCFKS